LCRPAGRRMAAGERRAVLRKNTIRDILWQLSTTAVRPLGEGRNRPERCLL